MTTSSDSDSATALQSAVVRTERPQWVVDAVAKGFDWVAFEWDKSASAEGAWYDEAFADRVVALFPRWFVFTVGRWGGEKFILADWQECIVRLLAGWKLADGFRLYRVLWLWIARKNGKTEFLAALGLLFWLIDGEFGGECYTFAATEDQARICFGKMVRMVQLSAVLKSRVQTMAGSLFCMQLLAKVVPLSGKAEGKHGLNASVIVGDEVHEWRDGALYSTLQGSMSGRDQPIELMGSTAGIPGRHGAIVFDECKRKASGDVIATDELVVIFAADKDDDPSLETTWRKASPNLGISPTLRFVQSLWNKSKESPRLKADFQRYYLNQWVGLASHWIPIERWDAGAPDKTLWKTLPDLMRGRKCFGGLDLSSTSDLTCVVWLFPPDEEWPRWMIVPRIWVPAENVGKRARDDRVAYDKWVDQGALIATEGNTIDYAEVRRHVLADAEIFDVQELAVDRLFQGHETGVLLAEAGINVKSFGQGFYSMSQPSKDFEVLAMQSHYDAGGHPVMRWTVENARYAQDDAGNIKPSKKRSSEKIDPVVSLIMATGLAKSGQDTGKSFWE